MKGFLFSAVLFMGCYFSMTEVCYAALPADFNHDGIVDFEDFSLFAYQWQQQETPELMADLISRGFVAEDCNCVNCVPVLPADFDHDWMVDSEDLSLFAYQWQQQETPELMADLISRGFIEGYCNRVKSPIRSFPDKIMIAKCVYDDPSAYRVMDKNYATIPNCLTFDPNTCLLAFNDPNHGGEGGSLRVHFTEQSNKLSPYRLENKHPFSVPLRLDGSKIIKLHYCVNSWDVPDDQSRFREIRIRFEDSAGGYWDYQPVVYFSKAETKKQLDVGWHEVVVRFDQPMKGFVAPVNKDITGIQILLIFFDGQTYSQYAPATVDMTFNFLEAYNLITTPQFALTFDDSFSNQYDAACYLYAKGLHATFYVVPSWIDTPGYLTLQQLQIMQQQGHLIANHTWEHLDVYSSTVDQYRASIQKAANWLYEHGFADGAFIMASPRGTPTIIDGKLYAARQMVNQMRLTTAPTYVPDAYYLDFNPELLYAAGVGTGNSMTSCEDALHNAYTEQTFRCVYFHSYIPELPPFIDEVAEDVAER